MVPLTRGPATSRPRQAILDDVRALTDAGHVEVVLTGANLGRYSDGHCQLTQLLDLVEAIEGVKRIRLSSIEPSTTERNVIDFMANSDKLCRHLHLPLQSGDDAVLARMGRRYTVRQYRKISDYALARIPILGLGTDIVAGLPGESQAAFDRTLATIRALPFSNIHVFPYSRRPGTRAAVMPDQVPAEEKTKRVRALTELAHEKKLAFARRLVGKPVSVLVEQVDTEGQGTGWSGEYVRTTVTGHGIAPNDIVDVVPSHVRQDGKLF